MKKLVRIGVLCIVALVAGSAAYGQNRHTTPHRRGYLSQRIRETIRENAPERIMDKREAGEKLSARERGGLRSYLRRKGARVQRIRRRRREATKNCIKENALGVRKAIIAKMEAGRRLAPAQRHRLLRYLRRLRTHCRRSRGSGADW